MNAFFDRYSRFAPLILRLALGFVFIWFGWNSITNTDQWVRLVPEWTAAIARPETLVKIHGAVELFFGVLLAAGLMIRVSAAILFLSILNTVFLVSGPTQVRDIGLAAAMLSIFLRPRA